MNVKNVKAVFFSLLFSIAVQLVQAQAKLYPSLYFSAGTHYDLSYYNYTDSPTTPWMGQSGGRLTYQFGTEIHIPFSKKIAIRTGISFYRKYALFLRDNNNFIRGFYSKVRDTLHWNELIIPLNVIIKTSAAENAFFIGIGPDLAIPFATNRNAYNKEWGFATNYMAEFYFNDTEERKNKPVLGFNFMIGKPFNMFKKSFMVDFNAYMDMFSRKLPSTYNFEAPETYKFRNYFLSLSLSAYLDFWAKHNKE